MEPFDNAIVADKNAESTTAGMNIYTELVRIMKDFT